MHGVRHVRRKGRGTSADSALRADPVYPSKKVFLSLGKMDEKDDTDAVNSFLFKDLVSKVLVRIEVQFFHDFTPQSH